MQKELITKERIEKMASPNVVPIALIFIFAFILLVVPAFVLIVSFGKSLDKSVLIMIVGGFFLVPIIIGFCVVLLILCTKKTKESAKCEDYDIYLDRIVYKKYRHGKGGTIYRLIYFNALDDGRGIQVGSKTFDELEVGDLCYIVRIKVGAGYSNYIFKKHKYDLSYDLQNKLIEL